MRILGMFVRGRWSRLVGRSHTGDGWKASSAVLKMDKAIGIVKLFTKALPPRNVPTSLRSEDALIRVGDESYTAVLTVVAVEGRENGKVKGGLRPILVGCLFARFFSCHVDAHGPLPSALRAHDHACLEFCVPWLPHFCRKPSPVKGCIEATSPCPYVSYPRFNPSFSCAKRFTSTASVVLARTRGPLTEGAIN